MTRVLLVLLLALLPCAGTACRSPGAARPDLVYDALRSPGRATSARLVAPLRRARSDLAPGQRARLAFHLAQSGELPAARAELAAESTASPELAAFTAELERMLAEGSR